MSNKAAPTTAAVVRRKWPPAFSIQFKIVGSCVAIVVSVMMFSGTVMLMASQLGGVALDLYDKAFVSVHYAHKVQTAFVQLSGRHTQGDVPFKADDDVAAVTDMLNNLDVVIDRAATAKEKALAVGVRGDVAKLVDVNAGADRPTLAVIGKRMKRLTQRFADDAFQRRNDAEQLIARLKFILGLMGAAALVGAVGLGVFLIRGVVAPIRLVIARIDAMGRGEVALPKRLQGRSDEIGAMVAALEAQQEASRSLELIRSEQARLREAADREREETYQAQEAANQIQRAIVDTLSQALGGIANGDLTYRILGDFPPEYERLRLDFNRATEELHQTLAQVGAVARGVGAGSSEISLSSDDLYRRTEQQAASLEETAAALDQITATVRRTAEGSNEAAEIVKATRANAEHSGLVVRQAVDAMSAIEKSSFEISQIIGVIDEIAFQTNLLALNAGVEAARAGDRGRGFAVVASEVRALAQRSAEAAKEIKALISASSERVSSGVKLVGETGVALDQIVKQVAQINTLVAEIAASAREQASGLAQVNTAVNAMDEVTQKNASMVEQSTAASHELAKEAQDLARLVAQFKTDTAGEGVPEMGLAMAG